MDETNKKCIVFCSAMNIYLGLSVGLSVYNKYILNLHKFPLFLLTCQFFFLFCISGALIYTLLKPKLQASPFWITKISYSTYFYKLLPIGFLYGSDFIFTNIAIANGPLAFVQMIKSGIPLIVLFFKLIERDSQIITTSIVISMLLLFGGQLLIYIHEVEFNWVCFIASIFALFTSGTKLFVIEKLLKHKKNNGTNIQSVSPINNYNDKDIMHEGENIKLNDTNDENYENNTGFIGMDTFSPAELMLTDSDENESSEQTYFYDVDIGNNYRNTGTYREHVELQLVETNKKKTVKVISPRNQNKNGYNNNNNNNNNKHDKLSFFESILDKLSLDNISGKSDNDNDDDNTGINLIKKEKKKVTNFIDDIPLNEHQKWEREQKHKFQLNDELINKNWNKHKKQKMHSMLALFYFMPISWLTAGIAFICFEYPFIKTEMIFSESTEMISLLFQYLFSAIIAIALNWCELFMIGRWNALSFCIFSVFKLVLVVGASWLFFKHSFTFYSLLGYVLCIIGVLSYNWSQIKNKNKVKNDIKQIFNALFKLINKIECFKRNKRKLYTKIWSEFPQNDDSFDSLQMNEYSDSSSDTYYG